jgi:hypothetical protein
MGGGSARPICQEAAAPAWLSRLAVELDGAEAPLHHLQPHLGRRRTAIARLTGLKSRIGGCGERGADPLLSMEEVNLLVN